MNILTKKWAYYNEFDKSAAAWIRELIKEGVVTDGEVDERDIRDVVPSELMEYRRVHMFAGAAVWDYALTRAGWPDDRRVWTGSCPCQPFSAAGKGDGFADERHLWPAWFHLIEQCRPRVIFGEQVSSKDTLPWIDLVHADLEGALYTVAAADLCSPSVGAPHIRQRLYFAADANEQSLSVRDRRNIRARGGTSISTRANVVNVDSLSHELAKPVSVGRHGNQWRESIGNGSVADSASVRRQHVAILESGGGRAGMESPESFAESRNDGTDAHELAKPVSVGRRGRRDGDSPGHGGEIQIEGRGGIGQLDDAARPRLERSAGSSTQERGTGHAVPSPTNGFWRDAKWIYCRDGKWRPVGTIESGAQSIFNVSPCDLGFMCLSCGTQRMLEMRSDESGEADSPSPQGRESDEQCTGEYQNSVRDLSSQNTSETADNGFMFRVWQSICGKEPPTNSQDMFCRVCEKVRSHIGRETVVEAINDSLGLVRDQSSGRYTISPLIEKGKGKGRVARLRGYGNAIVAEVAIAFIESYLELNQ
jgi:DNA (cytosine-5)-methyltransferase 1